MNADTAAYLSNVLVDAAMIIWAVALAAFAADFAFGSPVRHQVAERVAVGAGGPDEPATDRTADGAAGDAPGDPARTSRWFGIGMGTLVLGTVVLGAGVLMRGLAAERVPWGNMYEFAITGTFLVGVSYLLLSRRYDLRTFAIWVTGVLLLTVGLAVTVLYIPAAPLVPALRSPWLVIHVAAATIAAAFFTLSMVAASLYLVRDTAERRGRTQGRFVSRLPDAATLDRIAYRVTAFGFPIWTFAVVAGAIWAEYAWGRYWGWDPKETWSLITWIVYAAYLHARTTTGWRGRRAAIISLVAYSTLLFNFFGVNIVFVGLHSYGGV